MAKKKLNKAGNFRGMTRRPPVLKGSQNGHWKGGVHFRKDGYELVRIGVVARKSKGARYMLKHRIIMEHFLGRKLLRTEIIHHKNGDRRDNRIKNLEIMSQKEHAKIHYPGRKKNRYSQFQ